MSEGGHHEIEAAKKRLAAAKATAKKNKEIAESLLKISSKEVEEANNSLKEVEKKWGVVDVNDDVIDFDDFDDVDDVDNFDDSLKKIILNVLNFSILR